MDDNKFDRVLEYLSSRAPELSKELKRVDVVKRSKGSVHSANGDEAASIEPRLPSIAIPDYDCKRLIGAGGFGDVWLARNQHDKHYYAVKVIHSENSERELEGVREFKRRAKSNSHLIPIMHVGKSNDCIYYVMPLADNAFESGVVDVDTYEPLTLDGYVVRQGQIPAGEVLELAAGLLEGLEQLHHQGAVHHDVKPANILRVDGKWRLADPGLLSSWRRDSTAGTEGYLSDNGKRDKAADLFALGISIHSIASGDLTPQKSDVGRSGDYIGSKSDVERLRLVVSKACSERPTQRFRTASEMRAAIIASKGSLWAYVLTICAAVLVALLVWKARLGDDIESPEFVAQPIEPIVAASTVGLPEVTFQQGGHLSGSIDVVFQDTCVREDEDANGSDAVLFAGSELFSVLLIQIPDLIPVINELADGRPLKIVLAELTIIPVSGESAFQSPPRIHRMLTAWDEESATSSISKGTVGWGGGTRVFGGRDLTSKCVDQWNGDLGFAPSWSSPNVANVTHIVQEIIDDGENHGFAMTMAGEVGIAASDHRNPKFRPSLRVVYELAPSE